MVYPVTFKISITLSVGHMSFSLAAGSLRRIVILLLRIASKPLVFPNYLSLLTDSRQYRRSGRFRIRPATAANGCLTRLSQNNQISRVTVPAIILLTREAGDCRRHTSLTILGLGFAG